VPSRRRDKAPLDQQAAALAAFDLLARKAWSTQELTRRLCRRGAPPDIAQAVVADLVSRGYLDDEAFARWWAQARAERRGIGRRRLRSELVARGIPRRLVATAIDAAFEAIPEHERALAAGRRRLSALRRAAPDRVPARLFSYLLRRGYPPSVVNRVVKQLTGTDAGEHAAPDEGI
jgi:regulatory protein